MEKGTDSKNCTLIDVRMFESSCKLINPNNDLKNLESIMHIKATFSVQPKNTQSDFCVIMDSQMTASDKKGKGLCTLNTIFRGDFKIIDKSLNKPDDFRDVRENLAQQIYPVIRTYMTNTLISMGIPMFVPWSLPKAEVTSKKRSKINKK